MRQALYGNNPLTLIQLDRATGSAKPKPGMGLRRWLARRWELAGTLALIGSSGAYGVYALMHLGL